MKILHTSDWHIGKRLHGKDFLPDINLFFSWLLETIQKEKIEVLLVSGDIFDMANPSSDARKVYYHFLNQISRLNCQVIITGGNHDSPAVLDAPKELLSILNIKIVGGMPADKESIIIPLTKKEDIVVVAVPYLRDGDLRKMVSGESYKDRKEAIRAGIQKVFADLATTCQQKFPKATALAMGHLFVQGMHTAESERGIQVGNEAGILAEEFGDYYSYVALGHIHIPQTVSKTRKIYYSGSPIALSFSEKEDEKRVLILDITKGVVNERSVLVPIFRKLIKFTGTLEEVQMDLKTLPKQKHPRKRLIDVAIFEEHYDPMIATELQKTITDFNANNEAEIIHQRTYFKNNPKGAATLYEPSLNLEDLKPKEVFEKRLENEELTTKSKALLLEAFDEVYEAVLGSENSVL